MIYGYAKATLSEAGLLEMREVSFELPPKALRELAEFLLTAADELELSESLSAGWHRHASAEILGWNETADGQDVIVSIPRDAPNRQSWDDMPYYAGDE